MQELLQFMGLEGRLHLEWISSAEAQKFTDTIIGFTEKMQAMGPNQITTMLTTLEAETLLGNINEKAVSS